jgi:hypothetical protein
MLSPNREIGRLMMEYTQMKRKLVEHFTANGYVQLHRDKKQKSVAVCEFDDTKIYIVYPGYKAKIRPDNTVQSYDYRVDIVKPFIKAALSHANIIVDLYRKVRDNRHLYERYRRLLCLLSMNELAELDTLEDLKSLPPSAVDNNLLDHISDVHARILNKYGKPKVFNREGNSWDYSFDDIVNCIRWIVLQEDINYPIERNFEGRRMPFSRYYEAIHAAYSGAHSIDEVIQRALTEGKRPPKWNDYDYTLIGNIK